MLERSGKWLFDSNNSLGIEDKLKDIFVRCERNGNGTADKIILVQACLTNPDVVESFGLSHTLLMEEGNGYRQAFEMLLVGLLGTEDESFITWRELQRLGRCGPLRKTSAMNAQTQDEWQNLANQATLKMAAWKEGADSTHTQELRSFQQTDSQPQPVLWHLELQVEMLEGHAINAARAFENKDAVTKQRIAEAEATVDDALRCSQYFNGINESEENRGSAQPGAPQGRELDQQRPHVPETRQAKADLGAWGAEALRHAEAIEHEAAMLLENSTGKAYEEKVELRRELRMAQSKLDAMDYMLQKRQDGAQSSGQLAQDVLEWTRSQEANLQCRAQGEQSPSDTLTQSLASVCSANDSGSPVLTDRLRMLGIPVNSEASPRKSRVLHTPRSERRASGAGMPLPIRDGISSPDIRSNTAWAPEGDVNETLERLRLTFQDDTGDGLAAAFGRIDSNGSGRISKGETIAALSAIRISQMHASAIFRRLTHLAKCESVGYLSLQEWLIAFARVKTLARTEAVSAAVTSLRAFSLMSEAIGQASAEHRHSFSRAELGASTFIGVPASDRRWKV